MSETALVEAAETGGALLFRLLRSLTVLENGEMRCCSVTTPQGLALLAMEPDGQTTMRHVTHALGVSAGTATRVIDNLVRDGLVDRAGSPADRRCVCVRPTARGANRIRELERCYSRFWEATFSNIPRHRLSGTLAALELVGDAVEKAKEACCAPEAGRDTRESKGERK